MLAQDLLEPAGAYGYALLYFDIDHFKKLNSKYSESVLDKTVLPELQRLVCDMTQGHGYAYREGGDEFIVLLENCSLSLASAFAEELRSNIEGYKFTVDQNEVNLTVSIGLASAIDPQAPRGSEPRETSGEGSRPKPN